MTWSNSPRPARRVLANPSGLTGNLLIGRPRVADVLAFVWFAGAVVFVSMRCHADGSSKVIEQKASPRPVETGDCPVAIGQAEPDQSPLTEHGLKIHR